MALFANSLRCNSASVAEGRPSVAGKPSLRPPVTLSGPRRSPNVATQPALCTNSRKPSELEDCEARFVVDNQNSSDHAACPTRISISFLTIAKSIGLVRKASAPFASALRLVSA